MANVRCPMCSKFNPPDADLCVYCGARLKPVRPSSGPGADETGQASKAPEGKQPEGDAPDWLSSLRADEPGEGTEQPSEDKGAGPDSQMPDWLSRIRDRARTELSPSSSDLFEEKPEEPDWMKDFQAGNSAESANSDSLLSRLGGQETGKGQSPSQPESFQDPGDWLRSLSDASSPDAAQPGDFPPFDFSSLEDLNAEQKPETQAGEEDWMSKLSAFQADQPAAPQAPSENPPAQSAEDEFGWLSSLSAEPPAPGKAPGQEGGAGFGLTGFLSSIEEPPAEKPGEPARSEGEGEVEWNVPEEPARPGSGSAGFGLTGFLSELDNKDSAQEPQTGEFSEDAFPGWEQSLPPSPGEELPDWLGGTQGSAAVAGSESEPEQDFASWLQSFESEPAQQPPAQDDSTAPVWQGSSTETEVPEQPSASSEDMPDWLAGLGAAPGSGQTDNQAGLPDWLNNPSETGSGALVWPGEESAEAVESTADSLPAWFNTIEPLETGQAESGLPEAAALSEEPAAEEPAAGKPAAAGPAAEEPEDEIPSYAAPLKAEPAAAELPDEEVPDWLRDFKDQPTSTAETVPPLIGGESAIQTPAVEGDQPFAVDLPDWLDEEAASRKVETSETPAFVPGGEDLAQAELPEWVKEMRPIESIIPGSVQMTEVDQRVEKAGPLAGMRGVLPAEDMVTRYRKPPIYSVKLRVTEKQRSQSAVFDSLLAQESQPLLVPAERSAAPGLLLRVLVALLLVAALAFPMIPGFQFNPLVVPALYPNETKQMYNLIDQNLKSNAPVLVAIDYEPGLSGEMRLASGAVIDQLVSKNARIVVVSTVPTGPALAQQMLNDAASRAAGRGIAYDVTQKTVNLGFLAGGTISLQEFASLPQRAAPVTLAGANAWGSASLLKDVTSLRDFTQVIVFTDRAETGRTWIEQVQPSMGSVPLFMVASAQAAPLLSPYVSSGQVAGMVSGLLGGVMYEQLAGQSNGNASGYLAVYQVGLGLAFLLVLVGGLISGVVSLVRRDGKEEE